MEKGHFGEYTGNARCCGSSASMGMSGAAYDAKKVDNNPVAKMYGSPVKKAACSKY